MKVPFNLPVAAGRELERIRDAIDRGQLAGDGHYTRLCHGWLSEFTGAQAALLTHSCTAALEMAAILLDVRPGDEVIMPSFTFVSTANAVVLRGGVPVFVDIRPDTLNIDEALIDAAITPRTKAICVVHYAGVVAEMDAICAIARRHGLAVVEDAAHAFGSRYRGQSAGAIGDLATFSFHETKNIISGEGGALLLRDRTYADRAEIIRDKGTNRKQFFRGQVDKYTWVDVGSSYLPGELIASFLYGQLERSDVIQAERMANWTRYDAAFAGYRRRGVGLPFVPPHCTHNAHLYYLLMPSLEARQEMIARLLKDEIHAPFHYVPLHSAPAGERFGRACGDLPVTQDISARLFRLPLYPKMGNALDRVIERVSHHIEAIL
ncbi:dTDP-4-amino-4,6-dideoxygalactose transaminase [Azospirillum sp. OGB3]|uniref:dTDP-4-amino-4,6-dideoxygalactose transaminase n=1 Tax=Azospirillum sp. OGB3 TaxID=2587012 RepID=UPI0016063AFF|nr:dTDP-4-amino-4,6-dideoxygalactose transaminase [Azospirillum sp. OGB3]MBB3268208.1 dTDP-4-amino-4,6-dideoxygalactose transaminase [Azospirillum sp. OGB3]